VTTLTNVETYTIFICDHEGCGLQFALPDMFVERRRKDQKTWFCPNGHTRWFPGKTEEQKLRERADRLQRQVAAREEDLRFEQSRLVSERRAHAATKGVLTKTKRRVANGVCPCCQRSFVDLEAHMSGQHPDYAESK
jgi:hypothetical protein